MIQASYKDKKLITSIITETFENNPSVNTVIGSKGNKRKKIQKMAEFAFIKSFNRNGAFLSDNKKGAALIYRADQNRFSLKEQYYELRFAFTSIPLKNILNVLKRESYFKSKRPKDGKYYYFWFLGVLKDGENASFEIKNELLKRADEEKLPIYLETSVWRNVIAYQRYGFTVYHTWEDVKNGITVWFMKKEVA